MLFLHITSSKSVLLTCKYHVRKDWLAEPANLSLFPPVPTLSSVCKVITKRASHQENFCRRCLLSVEDRKRGLGPRNLCKAVHVERVFVLFCLFVCLFFTKGTELRITSVHLKKKTVANPNLSFIL